jgi:hypothetical protein
VEVIDEHKKAGSEEPAKDKSGKMKIVPPEAIPTPGSTGGIPEIAV